MSSIFQTLRKPYDYALSLYPSKTNQGVSPSQNAEKTSVLSSILSPFETYVVSLQSLLIWEKPYLSAGAFVTLNILYWLIVSWNRRFLSILSIFALALFLYKTWVNQIWPEIRVPPKEGEDTESWCTLNPGVLSVPELCKYLNDFLDKMIILWKDVWKLRKESHGLFCALMCGFFSLTGLIGIVFPGVLIIYFFVLLLTLGPGVALHLIPTTVYEQIIGYFSETDSQGTKICYLSGNLGHQMKLNAELNTQLALSVNEVSELRKSIEEHRATTLESTGSHTKSNSSTYDVGRLRSANTPKSAENFSMFLPEIGNSPPVKLKQTEEELFPESVRPLLELTNEIMNVPEEEFEPLESRLSFTMQTSTIPQQLSNILNEEGMSSSFEAKIHGLYWVYRKTLSQNKSLLYQKKYLLMLLRGYQLTEKMTLSCVNQMGKDILREHCNHSSFTSVDSPLHGRKLFRSVAYVVIAIQRMKYCRKRWKLFARVPTSGMIKAEVLSVFQAYRNSSPNSFNMSYLSLSSRSTSVCEGDKIYPSISSSASSISSRSETNIKENQR